MIRCYSTHAARWWCLCWLRVSGYDVIGVRRGARAIVIRYVERAGAVGA